MSKHLFFLLFILFLFHTPGILSAQEITRSEVIENIDGKRYYIHTVDQGQTLYSISRVYDVPVDELIFENPDAETGLAIDQQLRIPVTSREKVITEKLREGEFRYIFHIVKKGETLYGISRIYDVTVDDLKTANPEWDKGLKTGQYVKIPLKAPEAEQVVENPDNSVASEMPQEEKTYYEHIVKQKETLYGIARQYRISIDSLTAFNPGLTKEIFPGEVIRIPIRINPDNYITHQVREKTKLKRIAGNYNVSVSAMKDANPAFGNRLRPGDMLLIPVGPPPDDIPHDVNVVVEEPDDTPPRKIKNDSLRCYEKMYSKNREFKVALMIPLYTEEVRNIRLEGSPSAIDPEKYKSFNFIQFYEGFLLATEELEQQGLQLRLYVYDVDEKVSKTIQVLQKPELTEMDLIIGPFFSRNFKLVSNFAEMFDIKIVNPLTRRTEVLRHDNVIKFKPSRLAQIPLIPAFVKAYHPEANIILVRNNKFSYEDEIAALRKELERVAPYGVKIANSQIYDIIQEYSEADTNLAPGELLDHVMIENRMMETSIIESRPDDSTFFSNGIAEVVYASDSIYGLIRNASVARRNLVIVLTNNEIFAPEILTRLNDLKDTFDITVVGIPEWQLLDNLETDYLLDLDVHFFTDLYIDEHAPEIEHFVANFRERFMTHPLRYAYEGYDVAYFFLGALMRFGSDCQECLPYYRKKLLGGEVGLKPASPAGYENQLWNFCRYRNYKIERINLH